MSIKTKMPTLNAKQLIIIQEAFASVISVTRLTKRQICGQSRERCIVWARRMLCHIMKVYGHMSLVDIGYEVRRSPMDHATVLHAIKEHDRCHREHYAPYTEPFALVEREFRQRTQFHTIRLSMLLKERKRNSMDLKILTDKMIRDEKTSRQKLVMNHPELREVI